jgi:hypothetical protein
MTDVKTRAGANSRAANSRKSEDLPRPVFAYGLLLAVVVAYGLHAMFISGPALRTAAQEQLQRALAEEDHNFCGQFGMRPGTAQFDTCSRELAIIRQKQVDRDNAAAQGIL